MVFSYVNIDSMVCLIAFWFLRVFHCKKKSSSKQDLGEKKQEDATAVNLSS